MLVDEASASLSLRVVSSSAWLDSATPDGRLWKRITSPGANRAASGSLRWLSSDRRQSRYSSSASTQTVRETFPSDETDLVMPACE
jgi:hypothetical protein